MTHFFISFLAITAFLLTLSPEPRIFLPPFVQRGNSSPCGREFRRGETGPRRLFLHIVVTGLRAGRPERSETVSNGLRAFVHRRSAAEEREGCGYSVWLSGAGPTQAAAAERLLRAAGIRILSVTESGRPE